VAEGAYSILDDHISQAIENLVKRSQPTLSLNREAKHGYPQPVTGP
jgi:hypothetical protein